MTAPAIEDAAKMLADPMAYTDEVRLHAGLELYGTTKAALNRVTSGLAGDLDGSGMRVNAVGPRVAVMSEGFEAIIGDQLPRELFESLEEIVEAVIALCDCPAEVTGQVLESLALIADWGLSVRGLDGLARV